MKIVFLLCILVHVNAICLKDCCGAVSFRIDVYDSLDCSGTPFNIIEDGSYNTYVCVPLGNTTSDIGYLFVCNRDIHIGCIDCNSIDHNCQNLVTLRPSECKTLTSFNPSNTRVYSVFIHGTDEDSKTVMLITFFALVGILFAVVCMFYIIPTIRRKCSSYSPVS
jgi:hypothetical protein